MLIRIFLLLFSLPLYATVFQKQPVAHQVKEANGIVVGNFLRSKTIKLDDDSIVTQMIFKMNKEAGLQSELFGMDEIIVHYPGGTYGDLTVKVEGVPQFIPGENVIIMIKNSHDRYWGMNLGMGTFRIVNYGKDKLIVNSVFPEDRNVGQMKYDEFEKLVRRIRGSSLKVVLNPSYPSETDSNENLRAPASVSEGKNRAIASETEEEENEEGHGTNTVWLLFTLAVLGGLFRLMRQREAK